MTEIAWDGLVHSYDPPADWWERVCASLPIHSEAAAEIDPITYQVIRNRMYTINIAHGETVTRVSGSPVFQSLDFNMCILSEEAEYVMNAPFMQFLNAGASFGVKYIMDRLAQEPGINEGDVFICNDPWIGAVHEMDVLFAQPVFVDGKIFAWIANAGHQYDLGGTVAGGWPQNAVDVFSDPTIFPPLKLVDRGRLRPEIEAVYLRQSRMPDMVALDLRAQVAGCRFATGQLLELCEHYGADVVKAAMRMVLDNCQESFRRKLRQIPDGTWSEVRYVDEKLPGDRGTYRIQVNLTKVGDRIVLDNQGSEAQMEGPNGITKCAFGGAAVAAFTPAFLHEHLYAIGGAYRQIEIDFEPGLLNCVDHPAAVGAGVLTVVDQVGAVQNCINRMLACEEELASRIVAPSPGYVVPVVTGRAADGSFYGSGILDHLAAGLGARSGRDGIDTSGHIWSPLTLLINVEDVEQWFPLVYLYRREMPDTGGVGRWRAGVGLAYAFFRHNAQSMNLANFGGGMCVSATCAPGTLGGYPAPSGRALVRRATNLRELFAQRRLPADVAELSAGEEFTRPQKGNEIPFGPDDVAEYISTGGGGYGDPLEREPWRVAEDVASGMVSREGAERMYGVALAEDLSPDEEGTASLRAQARAERANWPLVSARFPDAETAPVPATGEPPRPVHEAMVSADLDGERALACERCGARICGYAEDFKRHVRMHEGPTTAIVGAAADPAERLDVEIVLRTYCCPGCSVLLAVEVARAEDEPWPDMKLLAPSG